MFRDENAAAGKIQEDDAPVVIIDERPGHRISTQLVNGIFVDEAGNPIAIVKPQTWY